MSAAEILKVSEEEYFEIDEAGEKDGRRFEFIDGEIFPILECTIAHSQIVAESLFALKSALKNKPCKVFTQSLRVNIKTRSSYCYPDIVVVCGNIMTAEKNKQTVANPILIIEVLSPSTMNYDLGGKFLLYQNILTLSEYVCLSSSEIGGVRYYRRENGDWNITEFKGMDYLLLLSSLDIEIKLSDIYEKVDFSLGQE